MHFNLFMILSFPINISPYLLEYTPFADAFPGSLFFPVTIFKLPKLPLDLLMGNFSFPSDALLFTSTLPEVLT